MEQYILLAALSTYFNFNKVYPGFYELQTHYRCRAKRAVRRNVQQSLIENTSIQVKLEHNIVTKIRVLRFILIAVLVLKYLKTLV